MRAPASVIDAADTLERLGRAAVAMRLVVCASAVVAIVVAGIAGDQFVPLAVLVVVGAAWAAARPDGMAPLVLSVLIVLLWTGAIRPASVPLSIVLAGCLLAVHVGSARAAALAEHAAVSRQTALRWLGQIGVVGVLTSTVWGTAWLFDKTDGGGTQLVAVVAVLVVAGVAAAALGADAEQQA